MMAGLDPLGIHIWEELLEPQAETAQLTNSAKEETGVQTAVETRCGISASDFSSQPASATMKPFVLDDNIATEMSDEHTYDWQLAPCAAQNPIREESSALVHGRYIPCIDRLPQADVTGTPQVKGDRARSTHCELPLQGTTDSVVPDFLGINDDSLLTSTGHQISSIHDELKFPQTRTTQPSSEDDRENMGSDDATSLLLPAWGDTTPVSMYDDASFAPHVANEDIHRAKRNHTASSSLNPIPFSGRCFPCIPPLHQGSSALVPGQYMPLYNPLSLAGITSAPPVQDETIHSPPLSQNNPAPQYPVMSNLLTANGTGHECVCTITKKDRRSQDGKYVIKSIDNFEELQDVVHCCTQVSKIPWSVGKLSKLTDKDCSAFVNRFKQKQKPKIMWSSIKPTIPFTGVPFAKAKPPEKPIWCPESNCSACISVRLIWTFPNSYVCDLRGAVPLNTARVHADICSGKIIPVAQYHISLPTRQAHTCLQNRPTNFASSQSVPATAPPVGRVAEDPLLAEVDTTLNC